jgi:two-component system, NarL family, nitrate/nitrite response regulator NarL
VPCVAGNNADMGQAERISILLADDQPIFLEGARLFLTGQPEFRVLGQATNGQEAIEKATELRPDVVVMDITLPIVDGIEATRQIRKAVPGAKVLFLTMRERNENIKSAFSVGASGCISKDAEPTELKRAVACVYAGGLFRPEEPR